MAISFSVTVHRRAEDGMFKPIRWVSRVETSTSAGTTLLVAGFEQHVVKVRP